VSSRVSRRRLLAGVALGFPAAHIAQGRSLSGLKIGVTDWNLGQTGKVEAVTIAKTLGFEGVEVSLGREPVDGKLPLDNPEIQQRYLQQAKAGNVRLAGTCLDILHRNYLKNDKLGQKWLAAGIPITAKLNARVMLLPFFGKGALETRQEMDYVGDILRELAGEADKAGVILGLEDTISAEDNVRIMERSRSSAVKTYYDVGNSTRAGFDINKEIRWLGPQRICQFHLKDDAKYYLGEGPIDFRAVMQTIAELDFQGFANLETSSPSKSIENDMRRNQDYIRRVMQETR
jgi:sugar phosphate isomerase/epimerase